MNELVTDLKTLQEETLSNLKISKSNNTLRAYKSDFKHFAAFCANHGFNSLPSEPKVVSLYLTSKGFPHTHINSILGIEYSFPHLWLMHFKYDLFCNVTYEASSNLKIRNMAKFYY